ncbi:MAG: ornithine cyclodeaminase family protein [Nitrososphaerales archaeon]
MKTLVLNREEIEKLLPMSECIEIIEEMFKDLALGKGTLPQRSILPLPNGKGAIALMPGFLDNVVGAKIMTLFSGNVETQYETHQGAVLLFDSENGSLLGIMDSTSITGMRTAAASAVATKTLAREDSTNLAILGSGFQAASHLVAMQLVRKITSVKVWSRNYEHAKEFSRMFDQVEIEPVISVKEAVETADIICTTTRSSQPVLNGEWIREGAHINAVGAYAPSSRELDSEALLRSLLFVDKREAALSEAGDFLIPKREGVITDTHIRGELGDVLLGKIQGRTGDSQITLFKSLGLATEDMAVARGLYQRALSRSIGSWIDLGEKGICPNEGA